MGIYDRDYERDTYGRPPGIHLGRARSVTTNLVLINLGVYVAQLLFSNSQLFGESFTSLFSLHADWFKQPWRVFELLTYGFIHSLENILHIAFNMVALWFFGRPVEARYGRYEFLAFYLAAIIFAGICWNIATLVAGPAVMQAPMGLVEVHATVAGASGGLWAVLLLFAINYPHQTILIWGVLPMPAWLFAVVFVGMDILGATGRVDAGNVAVTAHLGGALFGFLYYSFGWHVLNWIPSKFSWPKFRRKPPLRVHDPYAASDDDVDEGEGEVDEILRKIQRDGQASLTNRERRILERASREYQRKRH